MFRYSFQRPYSSSAIPPTGRMEPSKENLKASASHTAEPPMSTLGTKEEAESKQPSDESGDANLVSAGQRADDSGNNNTATRSASARKFGAHLRRSTSARSGEGPTGYSSRTERLSFSQFRGQLDDPGTKREPERSRANNMWSTFRTTIYDFIAAFYIFAKHAATFECFVVVLNAVLVTWGFVTYLDHVSYRIDFSILSFSIVFPLTFLLQQAFTRREKSLTALADLKAIVINISMACLLWDFPTQKKEPRGGRLELPDDFDMRVRDTSIELLQIVYAFLSLPNITKARNLLFNRHTREREDVTKQQDDLTQRVNICLRRMYKNVETLKQTGLPSNEASRINQYHWFVQQRFEQLKNLKVYRTPQATRSFGRAYLLILPWFFAPYFTSLANSNQEEDNIAFILALAGFTFLVLMGLITAGRSLEDPFQEEFSLDTIHLKDDIASTCRTVHWHYLQAKRDREKGLLALHEQGPKLL